MNRSLIKTGFLRRWAADESGTAMMEAVMVFPVMMVMFLGAVDTGNAVLTNKKVITASQVVADLLARESSVDTAEINDAVVAGRMALEPFNTDSYGIDIVSIRFEGEDATPTEAWRETINTTPQDGILADTAGLGDEDEGVLAVTVSYDYEPLFGGGLTGTIEMRETAIIRGRDTAFISRAD